jgi:hypothetical protein
MADTSERALPGTPSGEATEEQLQLARDQGTSFGKAVVMMTREEAHGEQAEVGDLLVAYAVEEAEGMYEWVDGQLEWRNPRDENAHIEVVVRDAHDGRFLPGMDVYVSVFTEAGEEVGTHQQPFLWHPWLFHYGRNWTLPGDGTYRMAVHIKPPGFMRHDKLNGARYSNPVDIEWPDVRIETGQKRS